MNETERTLDFAMNAKKVENKVKIKYEFSGDELESLKKNYNSLNKLYEEIKLENEQLKEKLTIGEIENNENINILNNIHEQDIFYMEDNYKNLKINNGLIIHKYKEKTEQYENEMKIIYIELNNLKKIIESKDAKINELYNLLDQKEKQNELLIKTNEENYIENISKLNKDLSEKDKIIEELKTNEENYIENISKLNKDLSEKDKIIEELKKREENFNANTIKLNKDLSDITKKLEKQEKLIKDYENFRKTLINKIQENINK